jgi:hypothetical protein
MLARLGVVTRALRPLFHSAGESASGAHGDNETSGRGRKLAADRCPDSRLRASGRVRHRQGRLIGRIEALGFALQNRSCTEHVNRGCPEVQRD